MNDHSINLDKLKKAGIVGQDHRISIEDGHLIGTLTEHEVNTLIAVKAKLNPPGEDPQKHHSPSPVGTVSF